MTFTRIIVRADQMGGVPCIRGLQITVASVVGMVADGLSPEEILAAIRARSQRTCLRPSACALMQRLDAQTMSAHDHHR
jgi:hypothetical protein